MYLITSELLEDWADSLEQSELSKFKAAREQSKGMMKYVIGFVVPELNSVEELRQYLTANKQVSDLIILNVAGAMRTEASMLREENEKE